METLKTVLCIAMAAVCGAVSTLPNDSPRLSTATFLAGLGWAIAAGNRMVKKGGPK